jgi:hypothetical protein
MADRKQIIGIICRAMPAIDGRPYRILRMDYSDCPAPIGGKDGTFWRHFGASLTDSDIGRLVFLVGASMALETDREKLLREAGRDIPLMRENIANGINVENSRAVIAEYEARISGRA